MKNKIIEKLFFLAALMSLVCVAVITVFIFAKAAPAFGEIGAGNFIFGMVWSPSKGIYGIMPMILGSIMATLGAMLIGVPVGLLTAVFIAQYAPKPVKRIMTPVVELLGGIPSVVYGFFGLMIIVPFIDSTLGGNVGGNSLLAGMIILAIMVLPTVISTSKTAIYAVPEEYLAGSLALGATKEQMIFGVLIPAAKSGILSGVVLGVGRAIGETMAIILVAGNAPLMPDFADGLLTTLTNPIRTMTANIAMEMGYATGTHQDALFATGAVLFIFIMLINLSLVMITRQRGEK